MVLITLDILRPSRHQGRAQSKLGVEFVPQGQIQMISNYHTILVELDMGSVFAGLRRAQQMINLLNLTAWEDMHLREMGYERPLRMAFLVKHLNLINQRASRMLA